MDYLIAPIGLRELCISNSGAIEFLNKQENEENRYFTDTEWDFDEDNGRRGKNIHGQREHWTPKYELVPSSHSFKNFLPIFLTKIIYESVNKIINIKNLFLCPYLCNGEILVTVIWIDLQSFLIISR
jgi:hypothetical protein